MCVAVIGSSGAKEGCADKIPMKQPIQSRTVKMSISPDKLREGYLAFQQKERRDAMYKTATFLVEHFWGRAPQVAEGLGVLLLVWNAPCYRHGPFDFDALEKCILENQELLDQYRKRDILSFGPQDDVLIMPLFQAFLHALQICDGKCKGRRTPVGVAKALHLLAPAFFPLWDERIAKAFGCYYDSDPAAKYLAFSRLIREIARELAPSVAASGKTLVKLIDEHNYARFSKGWVE